MALFNYATREINAKIVYYGSGLSGKTTNIQQVYQRLATQGKGKLVTIPTYGDRTIFLDFFPVDVGEINGFKLRFHLYTVPGQVFYNTTRKLVLKGADGVVFVADSQKEAVDSNLQSIKNLRENLLEEGIDLEHFPFVIQYNKRDLPNVSSLDELNGMLNEKGVPFFEAAAVSGQGVVETLKAIGKVVVKDLKQSLTRREGPPPKKQTSEADTTQRISKEPSAFSGSSSPGRRLDETSVSKTEFPAPDDQIERSGKSLSVSTNLEEVSPSEEGSQEREGFPVEQRSGKRMSRVKIQLALEIELEQEGDQWIPRGVQVKSFRQNNQPPYAPDSSQDESSEMTRAAEKAFRKIQGR